MTDLIVVIGDTMTDVVAHVPHEPVAGSDTPAHIEYRGGGSAANVAAWLAELGGDVALISRVGADALGDAAERALDANGVTTWLARDRDAATGTCIVLVGTDGERTMLPDPGANDRLSPADLPVSAWATGRHLHLSGYALLREGSRAAAVMALERAAEHGMTASVDASSAAPLEAVGGETFLGWVTGVGVCFANLDEARVLTGEADPQRAAEALAARFPIAIVKAGSRGAFACAGLEAWHAPATEADAVDTTGAGDAFAAAFLLRWRAGAPVADALAFAADISARAVGRVGGRP